MNTRAGELARQAFNLPLVGNQLLTRFEKLRELRVVREIDLVIPAHGQNPILVTSIESALAQSFYRETRLRIVIYDDCSLKPLREFIPPTLIGCIRVERGHENLGRAGARNAGAALSRAPYVAFLDSDCVLSSIHVLENHAALLENGADASLGSLQVRGEGFWVRYQSEVFRLRDAQASRGNLLAMTTANIMVRRSVFETVGGFSHAYRHYGFEDRDLIARLRNGGFDVRWNPQATAYHDGELSLTGVCAKTFEAAKYSAPIFSYQHQADYLQMGYRCWDLRLWPPGRYQNTIRHLATKLDRVPPMVERIVNTTHVPYRLKKLLVKATLAISYLSGTVG